MQWVSERRRSPQSSSDVSGVGFRAEAKKEGLAGSPLAVGQPVVQGVVSALLHHAGRHASRPRSLSLLVAVQRLCTPRSSKLVPQARGQVSACGELCSGLGNGGAVSASVGAAVIELLQRGFGLAL